MKNKRILKILGIVVVAALLLQAGIMTYAGVFGGNSDDVDISNVVISQEIKDVIYAQDSDNFDKNIRNYKRMIVLLNVHDVFKTHIEDLIVEGMQLTDLMIAYTFLNDCYGSIEQLEILVNQRELGLSWVDIFTGYNDENPAFEPSNFNFDYLDEIMAIDGITADDIMIADRVSQNMDIPFEDVIEGRINGEIWKDINAELGIVNGQSAMPRVPVTSEQLKKHTAGDLLSEQLVVETLVTAFKLGINEQKAIDKAKEGYTAERFFAEVLEDRYY